MLVITRKVGEGIVVDDKTNLTILEVGKDKVKIGIDAPQDIRIVREELYTTEKENREASNAVPKDIMEKLLSEVKE